MTLEDVLRVLRDGINRNDGERLRNFLNQHAALNWVIASDYVIGDKERHRDAFCYTIYPVNDELASTQAEIAGKIPNDLKHTSRINAPIIDCLRSTRRFSFCFVVRKGQRFFDNLADVQASLAATIEMVKARENWGKQTAVLKELRQKASAKNFDFKLFSDITLASLFAAIIAMFVTEFSDAKIVSWFSDRGSIVTSYNRVAFDLFGMHFYQACYEFGVRYDSVTLGVGDMKVGPWYDELIRVPDFLAGAVSAFNPDTRDVHTQKHLDLLTKIFSDAPHIAIIETEVKPHAFGCRSVLISQKSVAPQDD